MNVPFDETDPRAHERGFTLIEALIAIVILAFGMIAVSNLMFMAASSNTVANQGTAASTAASQTLELLKAEPFNMLTVGGDLDPAKFAPSYVCNNQFCRDDSIPGVGMIKTRWQISSVNPNDNQVLFIRVRSEGMGTLSRGRSAAEFTTFRSCTAVASGCPNP
jgi:prepilin-type N-terminal cleavage/methylation domain-containing protein